MLKRISVQHLTLGMYLHQFCGSWMDHPFWRTGFVLQDAADLARIHATAIQEVWIDVSKGLDVAAGVQTVTPEQAEARRETDFQKPRTCRNSRWPRRRRLRPPRPRLRARGGRRRPACPRNWPMRRP